MHFGGKFTMTSYIDSYSLQFVARRPNNSIQAPEIFQKWLEKDWETFLQLFNKTIKLFAVSWQKYSVLLSFLAVECMKVAVKALFHAGFAKWQNLF
jgi:hypothetical protein